MAFGATTLGFNVADLGLSCENGRPSLRDGSEMRGWFDAPCGGGKLDACPPLANWPGPLSRPNSAPPGIGGAVSANPVVLGVPVGREDQG